MSQASAEAGCLRRVELVVLSDLHLGTVGCQARPLLRYLKSIEPGTLVLNGDIINRVANWLSERAGRGRISLSKRIKDGVKRAVAFIGDFEQTAAALAAENGYDYAVCGHIHQPAIRAVVTDRGTVTYLNSGDWVENLTALEYDRGSWSIFRYRENERELERQEPTEGAEPEEEIESLALPAASALLQMVRP